MSKLEIGQIAPDFTAPVYSQNDGESVVTLSDLRGSIVILAFYPKDNTPGCTKEMCAFRDDYSQFNNKNTKIFGVSKDSIKSHYNFSAKFEFGDLPLISDDDGTIISLYGADGLIFKKRITFIVDAEGKIAHIIEGMPKNSQLLELIDKLID